MKVCPNCGLKYDNQFKFCKKCGCSLVIDKSERFKSDIPPGVENEGLLHFVYFLGFLFVLALVPFVIYFCSHIYSGIRLKLHDVGAFTLSTSDDYYNLAESYSYGTALISKDEKKAFDYYIIASNKGDRVSLNRVAECYYLGKGVSKDKEKAKMWLIKWLKAGKYTYTNEDIDKRIIDEFAFWDRIHNDKLKENEIENKRVIPANFKSFNFSPDALPRNIYLPDKFKRIREEEKAFDTSSYKHIKAGISLYGLVDYNNVGENDESKRYQIIVIYSKSPNFENIKSNIEEKSLYEGLEGTLSTAKQSGNVNLISKKICVNSNNHRYLDAIYSISEKGNPNNKTMVRYVLSFFDGKMYGVFMKSYSDVYLNYSKEFDIIAKTFGTYQAL